jgi:tyrosine decarboxylase/aspartate 1-decarboxylase
MDERGLSRDEVLKLLDNAQAKDMSYSGGRILGSMCTSPHELGREVYSRFLETNLGDAGLFTGTKELEDEVIAMISRLHGLKKAGGLVVTGGTEANILALWAARNKTKKKKVVASDTVHFSIDKACNLLGLDIVKARVDSQKCVDISDAESKVDDETCAIVGVAGTTEYGTVDDIAALSKIAIDIDAFFHVDAAFGGFVLPFLRDLGYPVRFDLSKCEVDSITLDPHKMGLVPIPCGCILFKDPRTTGFIETEAPYLTQKRQRTIVGTRSGAPAASAYAVFKHLGRKGYRSIVKQCMENTMRLYEGIHGLGLAVRKPTMNILVFDGSRDVNLALTEREWQLSTTRSGEIRLIVMPHVNETVVEDFLRDLEAVSGG